MATGHFADALVSTTQIFLFIYFIPQTTQTYTDDPQSHF